MPVPVNSVDSVSETSRSMATEEETRPTGLTKRALSGTAWSALSTAGRQVLTFASLATVARMLGPSAYGVMGMAALVMAFINNFRDLGTAVAIVQKPSVSTRLLSSLFWINLALGVGLCLLVSLSAPAAARFFQTPDLTGVLRLVSISFVFASCGVVHNALLNREMLFRAFAVVDLTSAVVTYLVALVSAYSGHGVWSLVYANMASSLVSTVGYWIAYRFRPSFVFDWVEVRSIARFSSNLSGFGLVNYIYRNADNLIVGKVLGPVPLGFYQMAYNMMLTPLQNISSVITQVLFPAFSRIQDDDKRFREAYVRGCTLIALLTFPIMAGLAVTADPLIRALLGTKWLGTIPIFQILAPVGLMQSIQTTTGVVYQAKGRTDWMFRWSFVTLVTTLCAFVIGVGWGAKGVATGYAIVYFVVLVYPGFAIPLRLIGMKTHEFFQALLPQMLVTAGMALICFVWLSLLHAWGVVNPWFRLTTTSLLGAVVYVAALWIFQPKVLKYLGDVMESSDHRVMVQGLSILRRCRLAA